MAAYVQPELDREAVDKAKQIFVEAGVDAAVLDKIDTLYSSELKPGKVLVHAKRESLPHGGPSLLCPI